MSKIPVTRSSMPMFEEYVEEIRDIWDSHWLTNAGPKHEKLELLLKKYLQTPNLSLFTNGHLALETTIKTFNLTGEVITTPFTFVSTTHAIVENGLTPVFCDIDPVTLTMDVSKIEGLITEKTSAIVPVHVYGSVCDTTEIDRIAKKYNLKVIYDAAHAFGVKIKDEGIGNFGDASMFSFHATKVFNTIEGGCVTYQDDSLDKVFTHMKNFGITENDSVGYVSGNAKMNEFQAAMGICNLPHIDNEIEKRKRIVEQYRYKLKDIPGIKLLEEQEEVKSNYAYFPVVFEGAEWDRDKVVEFFSDNNIFVRKYFYPLVSDFDIYKYKYNSNDTPIARRVASQVITLPLYAALTTDDINKISTLIEQMSTDY